MARKVVGATKRATLVSFRLNDEELADLERKRARRGLGVSDYYRTLQQEDRR